MKADYEEESAVLYQIVFCLSTELLHPVIVLSEHAGTSFRHLPEYKMNPTASPGM